MISSIPLRVIKSTWQVSTNLQLMLEDLLEKWCLSYWGKSEYQSCEGGGGGGDGGGRGVGAVAKQ